MSRAIKFRAWNGKGMIVSGETDFKYYIEASSGRICWLERYEDDDWGMASTNTWELMQYTGLKDKNGVEIYEGDTYSAWEGRSKYVVEWADDIAGFHLVWKAGDVGDSKVRHYFPMNMAQYQFEHVGNIYENPELLQGMEDKS